MSEESKYMSPVQILARLRSEDLLVSGMPVEEFQKYEDISWLMPSVDVSSVLRRLGLRIAYRKGEQIFSSCPDHRMFTGHDSRHPDKWTVNTKTGKTYCFTEARGDNLFLLVYRLMNGNKKEGESWLPSDDVVRFLVNAPDGTSMDEIHTYGLINRMHSVMDSLKPKEDEEVLNKVRDLDDVEASLQNRFTPSSMYRFFMEPPGKKKPTNIGKPTVDHFKVYMKTNGFYADRAIVPYFFHGELFSFCAIDILGEAEWLRKHPFNTAKDYRKTRFPDGSSTKGYLFGIDEVEESCNTMILVEGARERMKLWQEGFRNTLGINGVNFGPEKLKLLASKNPENVIIMLDGDDAGYQASKKIGAALRDFFNVYIASPGDGLDPKNLDQSAIQASIDSAKKLQ
jgi:hypothetical protein